MNYKIKKIRADQLLIKKFSHLSLEEAKKLILAGCVRSGNDHVIKNPSEVILESSELIIRDEQKYVSRGAFKLKIALDKYMPDLSGKIAADIGASTGGFTDLMLQYGATKVYAIDVGYGQLHYKLRQNPKVVSIEKVNARKITEYSIPEKVDVIVMDLSFISVLKVLGNVNMILKDNGWAFILIKPQFEAEKDEVETGGIVRKKEIREKCVLKVKNFIENELSWKVLDTLASPILGVKGNQEFVLVCKKSFSDGDISIF